MLFKAMDQFSYSYDAKTLVERKRECDKSLEHKIDNYNKFWLVLLYVVAYALYCLSVQMFWTGGRAFGILCIASYGICCFLCPAIGIGHLICGLHVLLKAEPTAKLHLFLVFDVVMMYGRFLYSRFNGLLIMV